MSPPEEKPSPLVLAAMNLLPSLPHADASTSYWQKTTEDFPLCNNNADAPVPNQASCVIIGSGFSGALAAFKLLELGVKGQEIVILEARSAASGSTGRNAGHVRPDAFRGFSGYAALHGSEQALKIVETEQRVLASLKAFIAKNQIPCDFCERPTLDVNLSVEAAEDERRNIMEYVNAGGTMAGITHLASAAASHRAGLTNAVDAYEWMAASVHPSQLTHWLLERVVKSGVHLFTQCPATAITKDEAYAERTQWSISTPRGLISTPKVIHCTNAYAAKLLPQLAGAKLVPIRIQAHSLRTKEVCNRQFDATMALRCSAQSFYALAQMPADGAVIFGIGRPTGITFDDGAVAGDLVKEATDRFTSLFPSVADAENMVTSAWTGLIAFTPDKVPYVGEMDELPGQYICAGFNGHGMANIFACASGVASLVQGKTWADTGLPDCYRYHSSRLMV